MVWREEGGREIKGCREEEKGREGGMAGRESEG